MRIEEVSTGTIFSPYVINPASHNLSTGDNFRDNVEKVRFEVPSTGDYVIRISHKSALQTASQDFALIYSTEEAIEAYDVLYFTGISQDFDVLDNFVDKDDNEASALPSAKTVLFIESASSTETAVTLDADLHVKALVINGSASQSLEIDLGGHDIYTERLVTNDIPVSFKNGTIYVQSTEAAYVDAEIAGTGVNLVLDAPIVELNKVWGADNLSILSGTISDLPVSIKGATVTIASGVVAPALTLTAELTGDFTNESSQVTFTDYALTLNGDLTFNSVTKLIGGNSLSISGNVVINPELGVNTTELGVGLQVTFNKSVATNTLAFLGGATITIGEGEDMQVSTALSFDGASAINLSSSGATNATFTYEGGKKCDVPFTVDKVDFQGGGKLILPVSQSVTNATGWLQIDCSDVLEAAFTFESPCAPGSIFMKDATDGTATTWQWTATDGISTFNSAEQHPRFELVDAGTYQITLVASNSVDSDTYSEEVTVIASGITKPSLTYENGRIVSSVIATEYRWYHNEELLVGLNSSRITPPSFTGTYRVEVIFQGCIASSEEVAFTVLDEDDEFLAKGLRVYPNPILDGDLRIESSNGLIQKVEVYSPSGSLVQTSKPASRETTLSFEKLPKGLYLVHIYDGNSVNVFKVVY